MAEPKPLGKATAEGYWLEVTSLVKAEFNIEEGITLLVNGTRAPGATSAQGLPETPVPAAQGLNNCTVGSNALKSPLRSADVSTVQVPPPPLQEEVGG